MVQFSFLLKLIFQVQVKLDDQLIIIIKYFSTISTYFNKAIKNTSNRIAKVYERVPQYDIKAATTQFLVFWWRVFRGFWVTIRLIRLHFFLSLWPKFTDWILMNKRSRGLSHFRQCFYVLVIRLKNSLKTGVSEYIEVLVHLHACTMYHRLNNWKQDLHRKYHLIW